MGDLPTTYEYTGQRNEALIGLLLPGEVVSRSIPQRAERA